VGQIISGLLMLFEQPFRLGDWIETERGKGRVTEVNWRAVHFETADGLRITPNSVLAGESLTNLSRPAGQHAIRITSVFAVEDRPDQVCDMLVRVASQVPGCHPDLTPVAVPVGAMEYRTKIPLRSPADDGEAEATFLRWIWYASRREGLHLDEAVDGFSEPDLVAQAIKNVVSSTLKLSADQQRAMIPHARIERYGRGELIQLVGTVPAGMSFIITGAVRLTVQADDGRLAEVDTVQAGGFIGQATLIRHPIPGSIYAVGEVALIYVDREAVERVVQRSPELLQEFGRSIEERRVSVERALSGTAEEGVG